MLRSYYSCELSKFLDIDRGVILETILGNDIFEPDRNQIDAWKEQIDILKDQLRDLGSGRIMFEYSIPRMGKRVDNVLIYSDFVFVMEFKTGKTGKEARYTTNKGIIPDALLDEMRDAYARSEEFLDQTENADHMLESKRRAQTAIDSATPEQLDLVLEVLSRAGKMAGQAAATS